MDYGHYLINQPLTQDEEGTTITINSLEPARWSKDAFDYRATVLAPDGGSHDIHSSAHHDVFDTWHRRHYAFSGQYEKLDRPLLLEILYDPMAFKFVLPEDAGSFTVDYRDVSYDAVEQYANELYALDIFGQSVNVSGAVPNITTPISFREYVALLPGERNATAFTTSNSVAAAAAACAEEYVRRISEFCKTGKKDFS